jgi:hypothetical protein
LRLGGQGVLVSTNWPDTLEHRMALACAATAGVICFPTAGLVWAMRKTPRVPDVHVAIAEGRRIDPLPGVVIKRSCFLPECDVEAGGGLRLRITPGARPAQTGVPTVRAPVSTATRRRQGHPSDLGIPSSRRACAVKGSGEPVVPVHRLRQRRKRGFRALDERLARSANAASSSSGNLRFPLETTTLGS